jgi:predicted transcriptional regulator
MRGQIEIITEVLELCLLPRTQTNIRAKTSLNYAQIKTYLTFLTSRGLLEHDSGTYATTLRGRSFLDAAAQLSQALEDFTHTISREVTLRLEGKYQSNDGDATMLSPAERLRRGARKKRD